MDSTSTVLEASKPEFLTHRLGEYPESDILIAMINQDEYSTAKAVDEIVALTVAAAAEAFSTKDLYEATRLLQHNALLRHAGTIGAFIVEFAQHVPHDQQSKLLDFVLRLEKVTIPNPESGAPLRHEDAIYWTDVPQMSMMLSEYHGMFRSTEEQLRLYENCVAFVAQLSEIGFGGYKESIGWNYYPLTRMFQQNYKLTRSNVRLVCMWLIYAPRKVQLDVQLGRTRGTGSSAYVFKPEFWSQWKQFLHDCQSKPSAETADLDTQDLIRRALDNMEKLN